MRYALGVLLGALFLGFTIAEGAPPSAPARLIADSQAAFTQKQEVRAWLQGHADEVARGLAAIRNDDLMLLPQYAAVEWRAPWFDKTWVDGAEALFVIHVPVVPRGTAWVEKEGRVLVGHLRPYAEHQEHARVTETHDETGRRVEHRDQTAHSILGHKRLGLEAVPQPGDVPVFADTVRLLADRNGRIYY